MIGTAKESIVLSTFDLRADDNGTKILAALNCAAARGVKIQLLIDGIYQQLFLAGSSDFQALASYENVEVGVYNPVISFWGIRQKALMKTEISWCMIHQKDRESL